ncbi:hypothetical protein HDE_11596 [Halotydeus destructor]|nr:hypothetical protein HDE_11596 [Halotydeus destructor]
MTTDEKYTVYRLVLTGGPCSGKTTSQARISTFFENLGWKVYRVPETATTLFSGGIRFPEMFESQVDQFQENLLKTMIAMETTFFDLAESAKRNVLVICDRGTMDAAAYMSKKSFDDVMKKNNWNSVELRDIRYNQVVHLITAAQGAEEFYNCEDNPHRTEGVELARELDIKTCASWVGHPYVDIIDNSTDFNGKLTRVIDCICKRIGIDTGDRLSANSQKYKFLVNSSKLSDELFPPFQDFIVTHNYLVTSNTMMQARIRKRGQNGNWSYQHTMRRSNADGKMAEVRRQITHRDYINFLAQRDGTHYTIRKERRCFLWKDMYFQMDVYKKPSTPRCDGLVLLECFTTKSLEELQVEELPPFLDIIKNVTGDPEYSMSNLSLKAESHRNDTQKIQKQHFFNKLNGTATTDGTQSDV